MQHARITTRPARREDAETIARVVAMAIDDEVALHHYCGAEYLAVLCAIARAKGTQYSWQNGLIAECEGVTAGAVVGYDGARLQELRSGTLAVIHSLTGHTPRVADETSAEEYYLDSVAVLPEFRSMGVGKVLVDAFAERAFTEGAERVGLIVDCENPHAERLYTAQGFECVGDCTFFGHRMHHLQRTCPWTLRERVERSTTLTAFQRRVYLELLNVPCGSAITYGELARRIGCRSAQAIGQALKRNPFAPAIPCHRVVAADGSLGGYQGQREGAEIERKRKLLENEKE